LVLIIMTIFLALTAFAGGTGLIADLNTPRLGRGEKLSAAKAVTGATSNSPIGEVSR
jgi:hypothetical protein